jgi:N-acetyl-anhydromuramoyl-L-alanine amidase
MIILDHWLRPAMRIVSPNQDDRPDPDDISLLVVHCISLPPGEFGTDCVSQLFCNQLDPNAHPYFQTIWQLKVSSHLLIRRNGEVLQYVPFNKRAWHAGASNFQGRERCNDFSIGIELEGSEDVAYTDSQYLALSQIALTLIDHYPRLTSQQITGHSDIAPGRKTDPGESFDWPRFYGLLENNPVR